MMQYTRLGKSSLNVSRVCLGCMGFGDAAHGQHSWTLDEESSRAIIRGALELGINFFDTAIVYQNGTSEQYLGRALRDFARREDVVVATKFPVRTQEEIDAGISGQEHVRRMLDKSLQNLGMDHVDLYIYHMWDYRTPLYEIMEGLNNAVKAGKARYIGISNCFAWQLCKANALAEREGFAKFVSVQGHYNLIFREEEREMAPFCREENIATGRASFESELKRCGVSLKELTNDENLPGILKKLTYKSLDDLYAAIGYGGISSLKVIGRIREDTQRILHQHQEERQAEVPLEGRPDATRPAVPKRTHSEKGIIVEGLSNCLVKFSKCCTPVPGDDIVGFITKGYGVSVHRRDCPNADPARRRPDEEGRWIKVSWAEDVEGTFRTTLQVVAKDRINLIVDISTVLSSTKTHVASMNARSTPDGFALITLDTDVSSSQQLKTVMRRIEQISGVMRVTRPAG